MGGRCKIGKGLLGEPDGAVMILLRVSTSPSVVVGIASSRFLGDVYHGTTLRWAGRASGVGVVVLNVSNEG